MSAPESFMPSVGATAPPSVLDQFLGWVQMEGAWYAASFVFHMFLMCALMLVGTAVVPTTNEAPSFEEAMVDTAPPGPELQHFELEEEDPGLDPSHLNLDEQVGTSSGPPIEETEDIYYDDSAVFTEAGGGRALANAGASLGGLGGFDIFGSAAGVAVKGPGGVGIGVGTSTNPGSGGAGVGFGGRGSGSKKSGVGGYGGVKRGERSVAASLDWLARHQFPDGHWSTKHYPMCKDHASCEGEGNVNTDMAATAMGLLPFLAAGQTHEKTSRFHLVVERGLTFLMRNQASNGDLSASAGDRNVVGLVSSRMYSHGLATIALCEAYGMTKDGQLRDRAQRAIQFTEAAQNKSTGGWRYNPGDTGDTSVTGWQVMALKSAQMSGLAVDGGVLEKARGFLNSTSLGSYGGLFSYLPGEKQTLSMTSVGLLCRQYMGAKRGDSLIAEGAAYLMDNLPDPKKRDLYYWYYATQVLHNVPGPEWDQWNRVMRRQLIESQARNGCGLGSWNPIAPGDQWTRSGGRLMATSLSCLTLEVYYRYLPLFKLDTEINAENVHVLKPDIKPPAKEKEAGGPWGAGP